MMTVLLRKISEQHFAHERRALGIADHHDAVDDERAVDLFIDELEMKLVGDRQAQKVRDRGTVERRQQGDRHERAKLRRVGHVGEHLDHADQRPDHAEGRRTVADRPVDLLALVEMGQEVVAVALQVIADESRVITVGDEPDALGEERILDLYLLQADGPLLAGDLGNACDFVDQLALGHAPQRKRKFGTERQPVKDR